MTRFGILLSMLFACLVLTGAGAARRPAPRAASQLATTRAVERATDRNPIPTTQPESPDRPVPFLTAEEAIETFNLPPGLRTEVVAAEPMVQHPVAIAFDPDGRLWVCEMRGYMPNFEGKGEKEPNGRVSILEDTDGDGRMDKSTIFLDGVILPRAIGLARDGALVGVPPNLLFCRDIDGDGKADEKTIISNDYGQPQQNPEHQANGLMYGLDNWVHSADYGRRVRNVAGKWVIDSVPDIGQWGISQDDFGRIFTNNNSNYLRADLVPSHYTIRNTNYHGSGANVEIDSDQTCWPAHPSAVNRGYRDRFLRDGRLREFTAACAPLVYRGDLLPPEYHGSVFVAEPSANLIRRAVLHEQGLEMTGRNAYAQKEFIASTYERFRPVNFAAGPDGALYVVDMHHGILQHRQYLTPYLKHKYLNRLLDQHLLTGRIYRIVPDSAPRKPKPAAPKLSEAKSADLIAHLSHPNGWWRDTAQRLLVERNYSGATSGLKKLATTGDNPLARIHALWTLEGMRRLDPQTVQAAVRDPHPRVRAAAIRVSEFLVHHGRGDEIVPHLLPLADDADPHVRLQFALTISEVGAPDADAALARLLHDCDEEFVRDAAVSGMRGRELEFLERLLGDQRAGQSHAPGRAEPPAELSPPSLRGGAGAGAVDSAPGSERAIHRDDPNWRSPSPARAETLAALSRAVRAQARPPRLLRLLDLAAQQEGPFAWRQQAMIDGMTRSARSKPVFLDAEPPALAKLQTTASAEDAKVLAASFVWPGKPGYVPPPPPVPLSPIEQARFETGKEVFAATCMQCHKADGQGQLGLAPPLVDSEWLLGPPERIVRIVLNGLRGPINVGGTTWNLDMPGLPTLSEEQVASVLTYLRREWDHTATPIDPATVRRIRAELNGRSESFTEKELLHLPLPPEPKRRETPFQPKISNKTAQSPPSSS